MKTKRKHSRKKCAEPVQAIERPIAIIEKKCNREEEKQQEQEDLKLVLVYYIVFELLLIQK